MPTPNVDKGQIERFFRTLDPTCKYFTIQTFTDRVDRPIKDPLARVLNILRTITRVELDLYDAGAGVWITVNDTNGDGRRASAVKRIRAVWQEDDSGYEGEFPLEPSLVIETSPGHFHRYWLVDGDWPADEEGRKDFAGVMRRMITDYGSDPGAKDISRVLRVPGFLHRKNPDDPHMVSIVGGSGELYTRAQILAAFPPTAQKNSAPRKNGQAGEDHSAAHAEALSELIRQVLTTEHYHDPLMRTAWRLVFAGVSGDQTEEILRGVMSAIPEDQRDDRWQARVDEIPRLILSAQEKREQENPPAEPVVREWPTLGKKAMLGVVGEIARLATATSEADPVAIVATTLAYAAAEFGRAQYVNIGDDIHHSRHFNAVVGRTSRGRKGTSYSPVRRIFEKAQDIRRNSASTLIFPSGCKLQVSNGPLSSGEGLVYAVRDGDDDEDDGVKDKRLLVVESELGAALRAFQRKGNTLSMILRMAFDGGTIAPMTKNDRLVATNPHVNVVGHITHQELENLLSGTEIWNGFGNRFQWLVAQRSKAVAFPDPMPRAEVETIAQKLAKVIGLAHERSERGPHEIPLSEAARVHWESVYPELTRDYPGILGAVTSRQEAHARRLALTYAQLGGADRIELEHLEAALAFTQYAFDSAKYLFGETELDPVAQKIVEALATGPKTQNEIMDLFQRNVPAKKLAALLADLQARGRVIGTRGTSSGGRSPAVWNLNEINEKNEKSGT